VSTGLGEHGRHHTQFRIDEWDLDQILWARKQNAWDLKFNPSQEPDKDWFREYGCTPGSTRLWENANLMSGAFWGMALNRANIIAGSSGTLFASAVGRVGLGQVAAGTAPLYGDTALGAASGWTGGNWQMTTTPFGLYTADAGSGATLIFLSTFSTAAYSTNAVTEFAVDQGTTASSANTTASVATMINHGIIASGSYGTKTSAQTWNITITMTFV
jgi:hypothetical protein